MDKNKIGEFIKKKRKEHGLTQEELANKLFVTEKAISRWETGRGTPDISLLIPLSKELNISVSELLNGKNNAKENINDVINYVEMNKAKKLSIKFITSCILYLVSILIFLVYLKSDYQNINTYNYFIKLLMIILSSVSLIIGSYIISTNYIDKLDDKEKFKKLNLGILFFYYSVFLFNISFFARTTDINSYNLIPLKTILTIIKTSNIYSIIINIFGNYLIFMPLNYCLVELFKINTPLKNCLTSLLLILVIETIQYIFNLGVFDIDDIILCTSGMLTFYFTYTKLFKKVK